AGVRCDGPGAPRAQFRRCAATDDSPKSMSAPSLFPTSQRRGEDARTENSQAASRKPQSAISPLRFLLLAVLLILAVTSAPAQTNLASPINVNIGLNGLGQPPD